MKGHCSIDCKRILNVRASLSTLPAALSNFSTEKRNLFCDFHLTNIKLSNSIQRLPRSAGAEKTFLHDSLMTWSRDYFFLN